MSDTPRTLIGPRTAALLYILLAFIAVRVLTGTALILVLILIVGLAAKSFLHFYGQRVE